MAVAAVPQVNSQYRLRRVGDEWNKSIAWGRSAGNGAHARWNMARKPTAGKAKTKGPAKKAKPRQVAKQPRRSKKVLDSAAPHAPESVETPAVGLSPLAAAAGDLPRVKKHKVDPRVKAIADRAERRARGEDPWEGEFDEAPIDPAIRHAYEAKARKEKKAATPEAPKESIGTIGEGETVEKTREKVGRPDGYKPEYCNVARQLCEDGATDDELAEFFGVSRMSIWRWKSKHQEFRYALHVGKKQADREVERSLYHRAKGYTQEVEKLFHHQGHITRATVIEHVDADVGAAKMWLASRDPDNWAKTDESEREREALRQAQLSTVEMARAVAFLLAQGVQAIQGGQMIEVEADAKP